MEKKLKILCLVLGRSLWLGLQFMVAYDVVYSREVMLQTFGPGKRVMADSSVESLIDFCDHCVEFWQFKVSK